MRDAWRWLREHAVNIVAGLVVVYMLVPIAVILLFSFNDPQGRFNAGKLLRDPALPADLSRALLDCPGQDAGFSPMTFAWGAQSLPLRRIATAQGWPEPEIEALERFRQVLVERVMAAARPDESS